MTYTYKSLTTAHIRNNHWCIFVPREYTYVICRDTKLMNMYNDVKEGSIYQSITVRFQKVCISYISYESYKSAINYAGANTFEKFKEIVQTLRAINKSCSKQRSRY